jgi:hypothetical protein
MIVVKIELWPMGDEPRKREIGRMYIANDGNRSVEDPNFGDYYVAVNRRGTAEVSLMVDENDRVYHAKGVTRAAKVLNYPRLSYNVWRLILRALRGAFPEETSLDGIENVPCGKRKRREAVGGLAHAPGHE